MAVLDILNQWCFPVIVAIMGCYLFWEKRNNRKGNTPIHEEGEEEAKTPGCKSNIYDGLSMKQLLESIMKNLGCHIDMCKENESQFLITYQGEPFTIVYSEGSPFVYFYDVAWYSAELTDIDNLALVRKAINECNQQNSSTLLYTIDKENGYMNVHTQQCTIFGSYIPDIETYLHSRFEDSFRQHHNFYRRMELIRKEQYS